MMFSALKWPIMTSKAYVLRRKDNGEYAVRFPKWWTDSYFTDDLHKAGVFNKPRQTAIYGSHKDKLDIVEIEIKVVE